MIRQIASLWGIPVIDLWNESQISFWTKNIYLKNEDAGNLWVHHSFAGGKRIAEVVAGRLRDFDPRTYFGGDFGPTATFA